MVINCSLQSDERFWHCTRKRNIGTQQEEEHKYIGHYMAIKSVHLTHSCKRLPILSSGLSMGLCIFVLRMTACYWTQVDLVEDLVLPELTCGLLNTRTSSIISH